VPEPKRRVSGILRTDLLQTNGTGGKVHPKWCLLEVTTHQISRTPNGNPKPKQNFGYHKFISFILSDVEKVAEFNSTIVFQSRAKWGDITDITVNLYSAFL